MGHVAEAVAPAHERVEAPPRAASRTSPCSKRTSTPRSAAAAPGHLELRRRDVDAGHVEAALGEPHGDAPAPQGASSTRAPAGGRAARRSRPRRRRPTARRPRARTSPSVLRGSRRTSRRQRRASAVCTSGTSFRLRVMRWIQRAEPAAKCCCGVTSRKQRRRRRRLAPEEARGQARAVSSGRSSEGRWVTPGIVDELGVGDLVGEALGDRAEVGLVLLPHHHERARRDRAEVDALGVGLLGGRGSPAARTSAAASAARGRPRWAPRSARSGPPPRRGRPPRAAGPPPRRRQRSRRTSRGPARGASSRTSSLTSSGRRAATSRQTWPPNEAPTSAAGPSPRRASRSSACENSPSAGIGVSPKPRSSWRSAPGRSKPSHIDASQMPAWTSTITSCRCRRPRARARRGTPPGGPRCGPPASCASCPPSASRAACACG